MCRSPQIRSKTDSELAVETDSDVLTQEIRGKLLICIGKGVCQENGVCSSLSPFCDHNPQDVLSPSDRSNNEAGG